MAGGFLELLYDRPVNKIGGLKLISIKTIEYLMLYDVFAPCPERSIFTCGKLKCLFCAIHIS